MATIDSEAEVEAAFDALCHAITALRATVLAGECARNNLLAHVDAIESSSDDLRLAVSIAAEEGVCCFAVEANTDTSEDQSILDLQSQALDDTAPDLEADDAEDREELIDYEAKLKHAVRRTFPKLRTAR
jgi:hypothetical protein